MKGIRMDRRKFLNNLFATSLAGFALSETSISALSGRKQLSSIGLELYTVRKQLEADFDGTLSKVALMGYNEVEFAGYFGHQPTEVKTALNRYKLTAPSVHIS